MRDLTRESVLVMSLDDLQQVMSGREGLALVIRLGVQSEAVSNRIDEVLDKEFDGMTPAERERVIRLADRVRRRSQQTGGATG